MTENREYINLRYLGSLEKYYYQINSTRPCQLTAAAKVNGVSTVEKWLSAVDAVQKRHPLLQATIEQDCKGRPFFALSRGMRISTQVHKGTNQEFWETDLKKLFEREMIHPLPRANGLGIATALVTYPNGRDYLFFITLHHAYGDGLSILYIIRDVLLALSGADIESLSTPLPQESHLENGKLESFAPTTVSPSMTKPSTQSRIRPVKVDFVSLPVARLLQRCKGEKVSIHAALVAASVIGGHKVCKKWRGNPVKVESPISTRFHSGGGESCVLSVISMVNAYQADSSVYFWDIARIAQRDITSSKDEKTVLDKMQRISLAMENDAPAKLSDVSVMMTMNSHIKLTNLGLWKMDTVYKHLQLETISGPSYLDRTQEEQVLGVNTVRDHLNLFYTTQDPIPGLLESVSRELRCAYLGSDKNKCKL